MQRSRVDLSHHKFCLDTGGLLGSERYLSGQRAESFLKYLHDLHLPFHIEHNGHWISLPAFVALPPGDVAHLRVYPLRGGAPKQNAKARKQKSSASSSARGSAEVSVGGADQEDRQHGTVRKASRTKQWHARFQFNRGGERTSICGPPRASRDVAEQDRERIAAKMLLQPASSRMQAAEAAIKCLREAEQE